MPASFQDSRNARHSSDMSANQIHYRPDIDGLRAVAILAVVLYHLNAPGFGGGFVGVDMFFAISGYLIVGILANEFETKGRVDWLHFFSRRARRLLPEAVVVTVVTLLLGFVILYPFDSVQSLAESAIASTLWFSNFYFWKGEPLDYFNLSHERHPLLHTWSLGVEEQFYLVLPVVFVVLGFCIKRFGWSPRRLLFCLFAAGIGASLGLAWWAGLFHPAAGFYLLPTRAYEIAFGAVAALTSRPIFSNLVSKLLLGMAVALILGSLYYSDRASAWPSIWGTAPAGGTALLIWVCRSEQANSIMRLLSSRPMGWLGKTSYSWYLWHFPLLVLYREYCFPERNVLEESAICGAALLIGGLSNTYVQQRIRKRWNLHDPGKQAFLLYALAAASAFPILGSLSMCAGAKAAEEKIPSLQQLKRASADMYVDGFKCHDSGLDEVSYDETACFFGDKTGTTKAYLWGDSHANHWVPALSPLFASAGVMGVERWRGGCPPILDYTAVWFSREDKEKCSEFNRRVLDEIELESRKGPVAVVMAARWPIHFGEAPLNATYREMFIRKYSLSQNDRVSTVTALFTTTLRKLELANVPVLMLGSVPEFFMSVPVCLYRYPTLGCTVERHDEEMFRKSSWAALSGLQIGFKNVFLFDPLPLICPGQVCAPSVDDIVLYHDDNHLSVKGARYLSPRLHSAVEQLVTRP